MNTSTALRYGCAFVLLAAFLLPLPAGAASPGKPLFERAYRLEKTEPEAAITEYQRAIRRGLDRKLRSAAYWRMVFLHKRLGQFGQALKLTVRLGSAKRMARVVKNLERDIQNQYGVSASSAEAYVLGLRALYGLRGAPPGEKPQNFLTAFRRAVASGGSDVLRAAIANVLVEQGYGQYASGFATRAAMSETDRQLLHAERLLSAERFDESAHVLRHLARGNDLEDSQKARILYLLGRIARGKKRPYQAVVYFRQAARFSSNAGDRNKALASYLLYRKGYPVQALAVLRGQSLAGDPNVRLLQLILRVEIDGDAAALSQLRALRSRLSGVRPPGTSEFLAKRALRILEGNQKR